MKMVIDVGGNADVCLEKAPVEYNVDGYRADDVCSGANKVY